MAILAGDGAEPIARQAVAETEEADSPASAYVRALALVALGEVPDVTAMVEAGGRVRADRAARWPRSPRRIRPAYAAALAEIVADFEARDQHLSGVAVADTALVLERLAEARGIAVRPASAVVRWLPAGARRIYSGATWGYSSAGRAPRWQRGGRRFEPV